MHNSAPDSLKHLHPFAGANVTSAPGCCSLLVSVCVSIVQIFAICISFLGHAFNRSEQIIGGYILTAEHEFEV